MTGMTQTSALDQRLWAPEELRAAVDLVLGEVARTVGAVDPSQLAEAAGALARAERVFVFGQGRSGIALRGVAMRLMHLGLVTHVVGETTAPAIGAGDVLLIASGSGTTGSIVRAAEKARSVGAGVVVFTASPGTPATVDARAVIVVPAQAKTDHGSAASEQYAGSLFEQSVLLLGDALFHSLWRRTGSAAEELWVRHANLE